MLLVESCSCGLLEEQHFHNDPVILMAFQLLVIFEDTWESFLRGRTEEIEYSDRL